jgi:hypothetical protein
MLHREHDFSKNLTDASVVLPSDTSQRLSLAVNSSSTVNRRDDAFAIDASDDTVAASVSRPWQTPPFACDRRVCRKKPASIAASDTLKTCFWSTFLRRFLPTRFQAK